MTTTTEILEEIHELDLVISEKIEWAHHIGAPAPDCSVEYAEIRALEARIKEMEVQA